MVNPLVLIVAVWAMIGKPN